MVFSALFVSCILCYVHCFIYDFDNFSVFYFLLMGICSLSWWFCICHLCHWCWCFTFVYRCYFCLVLLSGLHCDAICYTLLVLNIYVCFLYIWCAYDDSVNTFAFVTDVDYFLLLVLMGVFLPLLSLLLIFFIYILSFISVVYVLLICFGQCCVWWFFCFSVIFWVLMFLVGWFASVTSYTYLLTLLKYKGKYPLPIITSRNQNYESITDTNSVPMHIPDPHSS